MWHFEKKWTSTFCTRTEIHLFVKIMCRIIKEYFDISWLSSNAVQIPQHFPVRNNKSWLTMDFGLGFLVFLINTQFGYCLEMDFWVIFKLCYFLARCTKGFSSSYCIKQVLDLTSDPAAARGQISLQNEEICCSSKTFRRFYSLIPTAL